MSFFSVPVITRTVRPSLLDAIWPSVPVSAATSHDVTGTISSGTARKLIRIWLSDGGEFPTGAAFDPAGDNITMTTIDGSSGEFGDLRCQAWFLDAPEAGSKTTRVTTSGSVWAIGGNFVYEDARAGQLQAAVVTTDEDQLSSILGLNASGGGSVLLVDCYSVTLVAWIADGRTDGDITLTNNEMTTIVDDEVNSTFLAAYSHLTHPSSKTVSVGSTLSSDSDCLMLVINIPHNLGQTITPGTTKVHHWKLDKAGPSFLDEMENGALGVTSGTVLTGVDPLLADGGNAISLGGNVAMVSPASTVRQLSSYVILVYFQCRTQPTSGNHTTILEMDNGSSEGRVAGMLTMEYHNDSGTSRFRGYIRGTDTSADFFGSSDGVGTFSEDTGYFVCIIHDGTDAKVYQNTTLLATITNAPSLVEVSTDLQIGSYSLGLLTPFDGIIDEVVVWAGAPTNQATFLSGLTAAQTVSPDPGAPGGVVAVDDVVGNVDPSTTTDVDVLANDTNKTGPDYHIVIESDLSSRLSVVSNDSSSAQIRITTPAAPTGDTQESGSYSVGEGTDPSYGNQSNTASVSWTRPGSDGGGGYIPFSFVISSKPNLTHLGVAARPGFSPTDPRSASFTDPMSGLEVFRIGGNTGSTVFTNGTTDSGFSYPRRLRNQNNSKGFLVWNADSTLLMIGRRFSLATDPGDSCGSYLIDVDGSHGASAWQNVRVNPTADLSGNLSGNWWFWDPLDPIRAYAIGHDGSLYEWWPIGGDGHSTGELNLLYDNLPAGYGSVHGGAERPSACTPSSDGTYRVLPARRNSDGMWGGFRQNLLTGEMSDFVGPEVFNYTGGSATDNDRNAIGVTETATYAAFNENGNRFKFYDIDTNTEVADTDPVNQATHVCVSLRDGVEYWSGVRTNNVSMFNIAAGTWEQKVTAANFQGSNPNHLGALNWHDTFETYGGTGSGSSTGVRYFLYTRASPRNGHPRAIMGVRCGVNDTDQFRYLCNHRSVRSSNSSECHAQMDPNAKYVVFASNWHEPGIASDGDVHPYVIILPDGWKSPNNDGS